MARGMHDVTSGKLSNDILAGNFFKNIRRKENILSISWNIVFLDLICFLNEISQELYEATANQN